MLKLHHISGKVLDTAGKIAAQGLHCDAISARCAANPEINPIGVQRRQRAKLFCHHQGRMVGQHDATRTHTNALSGRR